MNVLLSAYSCVPGRGSEPGVGWNAVLQAARFHTVWVLTHAEGREEINAAVASGALPNVHFVIIDLPSWALFWKKDRRGHRLHYYFWQLAAYFAACRLHRQVRFDLIHHVTFAQYSAPSFLTFLPVPFIWGPVAGGETAPPPFWWSFSLRGKIWEIVRSVARKMGEHDPFVRRTARSAAAVLAATEDTAKQLRILGSTHVTVRPSIALPQDEILRLSSVPLRHDGPFRLISIGRLLHWKGFAFGLRAFAKLQRQCPESEYWIIGTGPERKRLETLARQLGIASKVKFWGEMGRPEVLQKLAECDVLAHPSFHESGGWVCLEAMAAGRPVVCLDLAGPALQVTEDTGIKVRALTPDQTATELAKAFLRLSGDPELRIRMGRASRHRVSKHFDSVGQGDFMSRVYEDTLAHSKLEQANLSRVAEPIES
jgi:glycosyltransferase involved in cell wall biosynthesis